MKTPASSSDTASISAPAARWAIAAAAATLLFLAALHVLSPEFDPSWRVVSEYANGRYTWVLSLMFAAWALSSWALAVAVARQMTGISGKVGLGLLMASGIGEAMAAVFDIKHPLHAIAGMLGVPTLPIAALLISSSLARRPGWSAAARRLLWTAHLTWISLALMILSLIVMTGGHGQGGRAAAAAAIPPLGWTNRLLIAAYCLWTATVAGQALALRRRPSLPDVGQAAPETLRDL
jgi:hypothetical membrane protein